MTNRTAAQDNANEGVTLTADDGTGAAAEYTYLIMPVRLPG